ncbi:trypsin-like peptidase domain-containing protein [Chromatium okenii]|uniref:trypsin-like peptidase domain-containing protein n=1 Tax=Chromatium okenii TaxID=61644 RepID=UPI00190509D3|nr:trypsin-like peptidase domain-containing protein [Chromatium okenii]
MMTHASRYLLLIGCLSTSSTLIAAPVISVPAQSYQNHFRSSQALARSQYTPFSAITTLRSQLPVFTAPAPVPVNAAQRRGNLTTPPLIGSNVTLTELSGNDVFNQFLHIPLTTGGQLLGLTIEAPNAVAVRLGLLITQLPDNAQLAFFTAHGSDPVAAPIHGAEINQLIATNRAAGDHSSAGQTYWSPMITGESATILIYLPSDNDNTDLQLEIPSLSHFFQDPLSARTAGFCQLDVKCYANWNDASSGVAKMVYTDGGYSYRCTGSLINDSDTATSVPYFLTANHCISTQTAASTLETHWFYQSAFCNSSLRDSRYTKLTGGAKLLYASANTDTSFLHLNKQPPSGVVYLGWTTATPLLNDVVTGIHHPDGDLKKISFGQLDAYQNCYADDDDDDTFYCHPASSSSGNYIDVDWSQGVTENGSSGSALFNDAQQIIGTLWGGNDSCYDEDGVSTYGRFEIAYNTKLKQWLGAGGAENNVTVIKPIAPTAVNATDGDNTTLVRITWNAVANATSYSIWRNTINYQASAKQIATATTLIYEDKTALAGTTYYYWIKATNTAGTSAFSEPNSGYRALTTATATPVLLTVDGNISFGNLSSVGDVDWYQVSINTTKSYSIETWQGTLLDNYMQLYGPNSQTAILEEDDDDGFGYAAKIVRTLKPGTYYIKIRAYRPTKTGTYSISIQ